jgi:ribosome-binding protein aMBF1 (putative translation factor)
MEPEEFSADPQQLRAEAEKEPRRRVLEDYGETIRLLKEEKGFSFREIAAWFQQRGLNIDHNAAWRAYSKTTSAGSIGNVEERNERYERKPVQEGAMPWLGES